MNRREFVSLVGVGGAIACAPEVVTAATEGTKETGQPHTYFNQKEGEGAK
jgi:hypothetical protein